MRNKEWGLPSLLLIYVGILGTLALAAEYGFTRISAASGLSGQRADHQKTILYERTKSSREIREALARPLPPPEPLPPITEKVVNQDALKVAAGEKHKLPKEKSGRVKIHWAARNAMAMGASADFAAPPTPVFDRGGVGGW